MNASKAKKGQIVYCIGDDYEDDVHINQPTLMRGVIENVYREEESIEVKWDIDYWFADPIWADCFLFPTREEAIADYIQRHTKDLVEQALEMSKEEKQK